MIRTLASWARLLSAAADRTIPRSKLSALDPSTFTDERHNRLAVDPLLIALLNNRPLPALAPSATNDLKLLANFPAVPLLRTSDLHSSPLLADWSDVGTDWQAIEVFTERELIALHACSRRLILGESSLAPRVHASILWLLEHLQPDNGTNYPWAIHAFAIASATEIDPILASTAQHYAETMLHNCQVSLSKPDLRSALILHDAASLLTLSQQHST